MPTPEPDELPRNQEVDDLYARLEQLEEENRILRGMRDEHPEDGVFKRCATKGCNCKVQLGTRYCPPCRGG